MFLCVYKIGNYQMFYVSLTIIQKDMHYLSFEHTPTHKDTLNLSHTPCTLTHQSNSLSFTHLQNLLTHALLRTLSFSHASSLALKHTLTHKTASFLNTNTYTLSLKQTFSLSFSHTHTLSHSHVLASDYCLIAQKKKNVYEID